MLGKEKMNYNRLMITIYLLLILPIAIGIVYFMLDIFKYITKEVAKQTDRLISILKFMDVISDLFDYIIRIQKLSELDNLIPLHDSYRDCFARNL